MSDRFRLLPEGIISAILCSRSFAINKPSIGRVEKEHILGLANLLERTALQLQAALAQQPAHAVPAVHALLDSDSVPDDFRNQASGYRAGWNDCLAAAPAAPVAQEPVALEQRATEAHALLRRVYDSGFDDDCVDAVGDWLNEHHTPPAAEQPDASAQLASIEAMCAMVEAREWADHVGVGEIGKRVESAISTLRNELQEAQSTAMAERCAVRVPPKLLDQLRDACIDAGASATLAKLNALLDGEEQGHA